MIFIPSPKTDWAKIMAALRVAGVSGYKVSQYLGKKRSTVQRWEQGFEPKHSDGVDLLALLAQVSAQVSTLKGLSSVSRSE